MDIQNVEKKLREARFFLRKMAERGSMAFGEHEEFDFYLSAFLSAGRSVDYRLRHEQPAVYPTWRKTWDATLSGADQQIMKFFADDRAVEVHESGSNRDEETTDIPVGNMYSDASGSVYVSAPPGTPPAIIHKPDFYFTINGIKRKATQACAEYVQLWDRLISKFKADNP